MGFKEDTRTQLASLDERMGALEEIAQRLGYGRDLRLSDPASPAGRAAQVAARLRSAATADVAGLDYGAIAFGLSEIKRKVGSVLSGDHVRDMAEVYKGVVDYFADVFAKSDPAFNRDEFNRLAQR